MRSAVELKQIFQRGWNVPARVENYLRQSPEFTEGDRYLAWRKALSAALGTDARQTILDAGTGPGFFACLYSQMGHDCRGLDFSERMLSMARGRASELNLDTTFVMADAEEPPFQSATFDAVSSRHLLFNLPRPGVAIREWVRLLKPGGRLILIGNDHDEAHPASRTRRGWNRMRNWLARFRRNGRPIWTPEPGYIDAVSECPLFCHGSKTLRAVMEAAGLENIHSIPTKDIQAARSKYPRKNHRMVGLSELFILVGTKPEQPRGVSDI
ncbi:MAG TPA: class I SAM-dependent methyltransferase [Lacipirellulaceae bacterium]|nr:class I SAM-dependent methyltransferase [Lacipirellulaceae bacterium]